MTSLLINEIFFSLQGETRTTGMPTVFIRLTGCPLRCHYCDTAYAFKGGKRYTLSDLMDKIKAYPARFITITGGEPLAQPDVLPLMQQLCDEGYQVSLETSGALDIAMVDRRVSRVLDLKTPGSGEVAQNLWSNIDHLTPHDQIKFVITDRADFNWAIEIINKHDLVGKCDIFISPSYQEVSPKDLAEWILKSGLPLRLQLQMHKLIWGDVPGH